ncbi:unnamed protein product [Gongylonema pulchrum]|uniref:START domain-containing protein n=1 Tax=Gongylonema pulchrum TaxID=637853 RepID=A0A183E886_9BILA|nr:unnamed protein product [Gongylonema pulchrum]
MRRNGFLNRTLSKEANVLSELNGVPESSSALVRNPDGALRGIITVVKCSTNQAYCIAVEIDRSIIDKYITIEPTDDPQCFQIVNIQGQAEDMRLLPIFIQVHYNPKGRLALEHLMDQLTERSSSAFYSPYKCFQHFILIKARRSSLQLLRVLSSIHSSHKFFLILAHSRF